jgi:hypothetical protein
MRFAVPCLLSISSGSSFPVPNFLLFVFLIFSPLGTRAEVRCASAGWASCSQNTGAQCDASQSNNTLLLFPSPLEGWQWLEGQGHGRRGGGSGGCGSRGRQSQQRSELVSHRNLSSRILGFHKRSDVLNNRHHAATTTQTWTSKRPSPSLPFISSKTYRQCRQCLCSGGGIRHEANGLLRRRISS